MLESFATNQAIAEFDVTVLRYMKPSNTTPLQFADDLVAKSCKVADVHDGEH